MSISQICHHMSFRRTPESSFPNQVLSVGRLLGVRDNLSARCFCLLIFVVSPLSVRADTTTFNDISSFMGPADSVRSIEFVDLRGFFIAGDRVLVSARKGENTRLSVLDPLSFEEVWHFDGNWKVYATSSGAEPSLFFNKPVAEYVADIQVYDLDGNLLFSKEKFEGGYFRSSPRSRFFYTRSAEFSYPDSMIFDRKGRPLATPSDIGNNWTSYAFNDSVLLFRDSDYLHFVKVRNGKTVKKVADSGGYDRPVFVAPSGDQALIGLDQKSVCIGPDFRAQWELGDEHRFRSACYSPNGRFLALLKAEGHHPYSEPNYSVSLLDAHSGSKIWSQDFVPLMVASHYRALVFDFYGDVVHLTPPNSNYMNYDGKLREYESTVLYRIDEATGKLIQTHQLPGVVKVMSIGDHTVAIEHNFAKSNHLIVSYYSNDIGSE